MDTQAQMQAIVDKLSGAGAEPVPLNAFDLPWRAIYHRITRAGNFTEAEMMLYRAVHDIDDGKWLAHELTDMLPHGDTFTAYPSLAEISRTLADVRWLWTSWIPRGMVTLLGAAPGMGKSLIALDLARRIINSEPWPDGQEGLSQAEYIGNRVLIVDAEGAPALLNQRAREWDLDRNRLFLLAAPEPPAPGELRRTRGAQLRPQLGEDEFVDLSTPAHQELLYEMCRTLQPALVVVDSLAAATTGGETSIEGARAILGFLSLLARKHDLAMLVIHHLRKRASGSPAFFQPAADDLRGSSHLSAAARSVLALSLAANPDTMYLQPDVHPGSGPRRLEVVKTNLCQLPPPLGVHFEASQSVVPTLHYAEALPYAPPPTLTLLCARWLVEYLGAAGEPLKPAGVAHAAVEAGFSRITLYRARQTLGDAVADLGTGLRDPRKRWALGSADLDPAPGASGAVAGSESLAAQDPPPD